MITINPAWYILTVLIIALVYIFYDDNKNNKGGNSNSDTGMY